MNTKQVTGSDEQLAIEYCLNGYVRHRKGCGANAGAPCTCGLEKTREEFFTEMVRMSKVVTAARKFDKATSTDEQADAIIELRDALQEMEEL